ncbi:MAG: hypothetical protein CO135_00025 [Candidatus Levybacteria bacterium CG_4_9_14_3_um_filter_35_16]|nr:MAG: hypothetical protein COW87_02825 [Candidatus Levybacteria bacterium CG22_combo_CG10-13_8_21_14_all_35_11]PIY94941.1 MAG: hypothetical protein COY68_00795 [Candidatus Levybacteria bacterium CG_4_10_14_0_8_um_filter_35_23]PJA91658.1 MAG: hypothetical protein CO135_00025 [Candidatus Levybacteria bacterium CG_4_9_14_3_um_filter_35_16]PJC54539.1 MAG: hypothetical protein CO028_01880 [Candidatus Levybacteria bacterium CG_4_9_14_0_2_um_filter_35_21]
MRVENVFSRLLSGIERRHQAETEAMISHYKSSEIQASRAAEIRDLIIVPLVGLVLDATIEALLPEETLTSDNGFSPQDVRKKPLILLRPIQECTAIRKINVNGKQPMLCVREISPISMAILVEEKKLPGDRVLGGIVDIEIGSDYVAFSDIFGESKIDMPKGDMTLNTTWKFMKEMASSIKMPKPKIRKLGREFS